MTSHLIHLAAQAKYADRAIPPFEIEPNKREIGSGFWSLRRFQLPRPPRPATA
jgi:hypothetical protein